MFYHDGGKLQYHVKVDSPDPVFAKHLQQAIGGVQGEIRVALQYMFQAFGARGPKRFRDLLLNTAAEELGHIEMLAHAVALNLEGAPLEQDEGRPRPDDGGDLGRAAPPARALVRDGRHAHRRQRRALQLLPCLRHRQRRRRHARQCRRRVHRADACLSALQDDGRPRHEGHAQVPRGPRHDAPEPVARRVGRVGRPRGPPDPQQLPPERREHRGQLPPTSPPRGTKAFRPSRAGGARASPSMARARSTTVAWEPRGGDGSLPLASSSNAPVQSRSDEERASRPRVGSFLRRTEQAISDAVK